MKKLFLVMALVLGALVVNAQRTPVKVSDLPKGVADSIQKEYSGYTIKESARNVENNVTTYEVVVSKGSDQKTLHFDNQGKSLKSKGMDSKSNDSWDMDKEKSKTPNTDMDKSTSPSSTSPSYPSSSPSSTPSSTTPSSTTPSSTTPSSTAPSSAPSTTPR